MKKLSTGKVWCFAVGQLGWSILAALISSWLVSYYQPDQKTVDAGHSLFIPQGAVIFGIFTILGAITAFGRIFDAITDPLIASASDKTHPVHAARRDPLRRDLHPDVLVPGERRFMDQRRFPLPHAHAFLSVHDDVLHAV